MVITQEKWLLLLTQIIAIIGSKQWTSSLKVSHSNVKCINSQVSLILCNLNLSKPTATQPFVTPNMSLFGGCQIKNKNLLTMRADICRYCAILDMYASCKVSYWTYNVDANMNCYCCTSDPKLLNAHVMSVSNEAFLLFVLINVGARLMSEIIWENRKVSILLDRCKFN